MKKPLRRFKAACEGCRIYHSLLKVSYHRTTSTCLAQVPANLSVSSSACASPGPQKRVRKLMISLQKTLFSFCSLVGLLLGVGIFIAFPWGGQSAEQCQVRSWSQGRSGPGKTRSLLRLGVPCQLAPLIASVWAAMSCGLPYTKEKRWLLLPFLDGLIWESKISPWSWKVFW